MKMRENGRLLASLGTLFVAGGMAAVACSKVETVNTEGTNAGVNVAVCGTLSATQAAQIAVTQLEHFGNEGLAALAGLENSRVAARLLTFGDSNILDPFVAEGQSDLHDALVKLRDEQLVASNVESASGSTVTFLLRPETVCSRAYSNSSPALPAGGASSVTSTGGSTSTSTLDPDCVTENTSHPKRIRISRIACNQGDNVAIEVLVGPTSERVIEVALYPDHADGALDLGALLRQSYSVSYTYSAATSSSAPVVSKRTEKPLASAATGEVVGTLTLVGSHHAKGYASISKAIDITLTDSAATHLQFAAAPNAVTVEANGDAKTIAVSVNGGQIDWRTKFTYFINDFFGLDTTTAADTAEAVSLRLPQVQGTLTFDGTTDTITGTNLNVGSAGFTATQGSNTLLAFTASGTSGTPIAATFTGKSNNDFGLALPQGLSVKVKYGLQPVWSLVTNPANFIASDTLTVTAAEASSFTLFNDPYTNSISLMQSPTGQLLRVDSGSLGMASAAWPSDTVTASSSQCLTRTVTSTANHNDLLDDFTTGACVVQ